MVEVHELSKSFLDPKRGEIRAVDRVSFTAKPGRILGLLGVNGAGKTTTLRMLSTVISPGHGTALVGGFDISKDPTRVRETIGFVSGSTGLYGRLSAKECLEYFGQLYGLSGAQLSEAMSLVSDQLNLHEFLNQLCDKLSTGQKQRVSIARAIIHNPPIMFFDEPTAGLDVLASQSIMEFIEGCRDQGKTVVFSTHIMSEVERLCDDVVVIHEGQVRAFGSADDMKIQSGTMTLEQAFLNLLGYERGDA
ncbi:MAG: ATP-binding cassette domain-containing protein [Fimbriimonadaceae bacterium]|nr:ATP-binding cassette domain-containing protein [Fimbriimonadaceae bacterium]